MKKIILIIFTILFLSTVVTSDVNKFTVKFTIIFENCTLEQATKVEKELLEKYHNVDITIDKKIEKKDTFIICDSLHYYHP